MIRLTINLISNGDKIVNSIPKTWKKVLKESQRHSSNLVLLDHYLLENNCSPSIDKMNSNEIYSIIIENFQKVGP